MPFIHSNKKYIERSMYLINPYTNTPATPSMTMEAFVAPSDFNPDAQELNIVKAFDTYLDANKIFVYSVSSTVSSTALDTSTGRSYAYSENGGSYNIIASGTINWTSGSNKRHVIVMDTNRGNNSTHYNLSGAIWVYVGENSDTNLVDISKLLKYIHFDSTKVNYISFSNTSFYGSRLTGILNIKNVASISGLSFYGCTLLTSLVVRNAISIGSAAFRQSGISSVTLNEGLKYIYDRAFVYTPLTTITFPSTLLLIDTDCFYGVNFTSINCKAVVPPTLNSSTTFTCSKSIPIHVPAGSKSAYQAAAYWSAFTNIIEDL